MDRRFLGRHEARAHVHAVSAERNGRDKAGRVRHAARGERIHGKPPATAECHLRSYSTLRRRSCNATQRRTKTRRVWCEKRSEMQLAGGSATPLAPGGWLPGTMAAGARFAHSRHANETGDQPLGFVFILPRVKAR